MNNRNNNKGVPANANNVHHNNGHYLLDEYMSFKKDGKFVDGLQELKLYVETHPDDAKIFNFKTIAEINDICLKIKDETVIDLSPVKDILPSADAKFGEGDFTHIPKEKYETFNINDPSVVAGKNSPPQVTYMANLFTYFFTHVIENNNNRLFVVGGIFPSFLLHQILKDYDFIVVSGHQNMTTLLKHIAQYFMVFVAIAQSQGKLPSGNIMFTTAEPKKKGSDEIATRQYNVKIEDEANDFEGLDFVLLRSVSENGYEENIASAYNNEFSNESLKQNLVKDALRRETYLNALYGEMMINDKLDTNIVCADFYKGTDMEEGYTIAFKKWQHIPTYGISTFIGNMFRLNRIVKLYLKKYFDPEPTLMLLTKPENLIQIHKEIVEGARNIYGDANNSYKTVIFELLVKKSELLRKNNGNNIVMNELIHIFYYMPYLFGLDANKIPQNKLLFETRVRNILLKHIKDYSTAKENNVFHRVKLAEEKYSENLYEDKLYVTRFNKVIDSMIQTHEKLLKTINKNIKLRKDQQATLNTLKEELKGLDNEKAIKKNRKKQWDIEQNQKKQLDIEKKMKIQSSEKEVENLQQTINQLQKEKIQSGNDPMNSSIREDVYRSVDKSIRQEAKKHAISYGYEMGVPNDDLTMALIIFAFIVPETNINMREITSKYKNTYSGILYGTFTKSIRNLIIPKTYETYLYLFENPSANNKRNNSRNAMTAPNQTRKNNNSTAGGGTRKYKKKKQSRKLKRNNRGRLTLRK